MLPCNDNMHAIIEALAAPPVTNGLPESTANGKWDSRG
jgi:hypothetical protein